MPKQYQNIAFKKIIYPLFIKAASSRQIVPVQHERVPQKLKQQPLEDGRALTFKPFLITHKYPFLIIHK